jgi:hypothetical protein
MSFGLIIGSCNVVSADLRPKSPSGFRAGLGVQYVTLGSHFDYRFMLKAIPWASVRWGNPPQN